MTPPDSALVLLRDELQSARDGNGQLAAVARWMLPLVLAVEEQRARLAQVERVQLLNASTVAAHDRALTSHAELLQSRTPASATEALVAGLRAENEHLRRLVDYGSRGDKATEMIDALTKERDELRETRVAIERQTADAIAAWLLGQAAAHAGETDPSTMPGIVASDEADVIESLAADIRAGKWRSP